MKPPRIINGTTELVAVDAVQPHPRNVNQGDIGAIHESITANGFFGSLVVQQSTGHILAGTHRWRAAQQAGYKTLPVTWIDAPDDVALRIMLADNRTARLGMDDPANLAELLQEILSDAGTLEGTGFDVDALDELLNDLGNPLRPTDPANDPNSEWEGMPEYEHEDKTAFRSLVVHFKDNASVIAFANLVGQNITEKTRYLWYPGIEIERYADKRYAPES